MNNDELLKRISNNYEGLTDKTGPWNFLEKILGVNSRVAYCIVFSRVL